MAGRCGSVAKLSEYFSTKVSNLKQGLILLDGIKDENGRKMLISMQAEMVKLETFMEELRNELEMKKKTMQTVEALKSEIIEFQKKVGQDLDQLPAHLPHTKIAQLKPPCKKEVTFHKSTPMYKNQKGRVLDSPVGSICDETFLPSVDQIRKNSPALFISEMEYLTVDEFNEVPKYMKSRLPYEQINAAIDELNKAMTAKYVLINIAKNKQTDKIRTTLREYKAQETAETKGYNFIVENDILVSSRLKLDKNGRNILTILRHCGRLREVRGNKLVRYIFA